MSWNQHKRQWASHVTAQTICRVTAAHAVMEDRVENWITSGSAQSTFNGNRYLPRPQDTQNLDYRHPYIAKI